MESSENRKPRLSRGPRQTRFSSAGVDVTGSDLNFVGVLLWVFLQNAAFILGGAGQQVGKITPYLHMQIFRPSGTSFSKNIFTAPGVRQVLSVLTSVAFSAFRDVFYKKYFLIWASVPAGPKNTPYLYM
jgi:hypothetical protein